MNEKEFFTTLLDVIDSLIGEGTAADVRTKNKRVSLREGLEAHYSDAPETKADTEGFLSRIGL
jgi:hypothetical protein